MKKNILPHKFECQPIRKRRIEHPPRLESIKRIRKAEVQEILDASESSFTHERENTSEQENFTLKTEIDFEVSMISNLL